MKEPKDCENIQEVRDSIDELDYQILALFGKRFKYVEEIVKFKTNKEGIIARDRQLEVLQKRKEWAGQFGLNPELFVEIYETLIYWNIQKEMEILDNKEKVKI